MMEIIRKYPQQYKIKCSICGLEKNINKRYFDHKGYEHKCLEATPKPLEATPSNSISLGEVTEITIESIPLEATPEEIKLDERHIDTEVILNKKSKKK